MRITTRANRLLVLILVVSVGLRVAIAVLMGDRVEPLPGIYDQVSYDMLARQVTGGHGFTVATDWWPLTRAGQPTAHWSYLYTLYLAALYLLFGPHPLIARLLQALVVGVLQPYLIYQIALRILPATPPDGQREVRSGALQRVPVAPLLAAAWMALYGYLAYYDAALMTEPFYITAILWALCLALGIAAGQSQPRRWLALGMALAIAVLLRQLLLLFVPFLLAWLWLATWPTLGLRRLLASTSIVLAVLAIAILPWTVRNYLAFHQFVLLNTNSGYAFFWANHPYYGTHFVGILPSGISYQDLVPPELRLLDEAALDKALLMEGFRFIVQDPVRYVLLSFSRLPVYFLFWPSSESGLLSNIVRVLSFTVALPFMLYGCWRTARITCLAHRAQALPIRSLATTPASLLMLFAMVYAAIHLLSWALVRYRLPIDAVLIIFAGYGLADLVARARQRAVSTAYQP